MPDLAWTLANAGAEVQIIVGQVSVLTGDTFTMSWQGADMHNVSRLAGYTPVVGETVHCLLIDGYGCFALGKLYGTGAAVPDLPSPTISLIPALSVATWDETVQLWAPGVINQSPTEGAAWLYDGALFEPLAGSMLAAFEIEITRLSGGPTELFVHNNTDVLSALSLADETIFPTPITPLGVPTWVQLPLGWGEMLLNDEATGIGVGTGQYTATYSGTGRLRVTTI